MTAVQTSGGQLVRPDLITVFIDGTEIQVPKGTLAIRAAEMIGIAIPRFCDHPLLDPQGACRQCLVDVPDMGNGRGMPKLQAACTLECAPGMKISTQQTSPAAAKAQQGIMELLLINHPLDCPICDKGGECPLQNQAMTTGRGESRYDGVKRTYPKPVSISSQILLDRERCVLCARCTRFSEQISGDPFIALVERGALQQVGFYEDQPYDSYFSGNVVQICPVGALTSADYRFQSRPFDLVSTPTTCELCASGCQLRTDHRHYQVKRRLAGDEPEVNEEWNCDRGRFAFVSGRGDDRLTHPLIRENGVLRVASWPEAIDAAVAGLTAAGASVGVLTGGRLTLEAAYAYGKFARAVLGTNNIDFRARAHSEEEAQFLGARVAGVPFGSGVTYRALEEATQVVLVAFEPEEESPIVFLRLFKAVRKKGLKVVTIAPYLSNGSAKLGAQVIATAPGAEAAALSRLALDPGTIVLVGERAASLPGLFSTAASIAQESAASVAWIPRRAGDRGAVEAGCLPDLLPGGRPITHTAARVDVQVAWGAESLPSAQGLDGNAQLAAAAEGRLTALVVAGVEAGDLAHVQASLSAIEKAPFVVSLEQRRSQIADLADVVFPVALIEEQAGTFLNWEHRPGRVNQVNKQNTAPMTDIRVLAALADAMGGDLGFRTARQAKAEFDELGVWEGGRLADPQVWAPTNQMPAGSFMVASWRHLIDGSRSNDGQEALQATAKPVVARVSARTARQVGLSNGDRVTVRTAAGSWTMPVVIEPTMVDGTVWVPGNDGTNGLGVLDIDAGGFVQLTPGGAA